MPRDYMIFLDSMQSPVVHLHEFKLHLISVVVKVIIEGG